MIERMAFGRTGHLSTRTLFGAAAFWAVTQDEADATFELLERYGVNHVDTAASYGESEVHVGSWIARHGRPSFLATKTMVRTAREAREELQRSLEKLHVDYVDLWQLHYLVDEKEWEVAMGPGGVLEAALEAREQGLVRHIGVTGHDVAVARMHRRSLERFDFDSVLLPYNFVMMQNPAYAAEFEPLLQTCQAHGVAVQCIKSLVHSPWGVHPRSAGTWYRPLEAQGDIDKAVAWVLGRPGVFLNTPGDIHVLPKVLDAAARYTARPSDEEMRALAAEREMAPLFT